MDEEKTKSVLGESNCPQRRRSARLSSPQTSASKMAATAVVKRSIVVKKIVPRKTTLPTEHNKENTQRLTEGGQENQQKPAIPKSMRVPPSKPATPNSVRVPPSKPAIPSPILASSPPSVETVTDPDDLAWSNKVRRSYSRLSDQSFNSPNSRKTMFGFQQLNTPEVVPKLRQSKRALENSGSFSGLSFTSLLEANDSLACHPEPDLAIPGVAMEKTKKKRRKKVQPLDVSELDALSAKMNAEFEEAEGFELVVE